MELSNGPLTNGTRFHLRAAPPRPGGHLFLKSLPGAEPCRLLRESSPGAPTKLSELPPHLRSRPLDPAPGGASDENLAGCRRFRSANRGKRIGSPNLAYGFRARSRGGLEGDRPLSSFAVPRIDRKSSGRSCGRSRAQCAYGAKEPGRNTRSGRFRYWLFVAGLFDPVAVRHDQDRPDLCRRDRKLGVRPETP